MQVESSERIRNIAVAGHNDTGKTTLASALIYTGGVTNRLNRVEDGNTLTDFDQEEIDREISIGLGVCFVPWKQHKVNIVDCPGYGIFLNEIRSGMRAADATVLAVNGVAGIEVNTEKIWSFAEEFDQPVMLLMTKMDRERADFDARVQEIQKSFGREAIPIHIPIGKEQDFEGVIDLIGGKAYLYAKDENGMGKAAEVPEALAETVATWRDRLVEAVAESDDQLLEKFFEEGTLSEEEFQQGLRSAINQRKIFPISLGSALHGLGTSSLLDAVVDLLPAPTDCPSFPASTIGDDPTEMTPDPSGPPAALVFKTMSDPFTGKLSLLRVVSGELESDHSYWNAHREGDERVGHLMAMQGRQGTQVNKLLTGDIGGVAKLKLSHTGDTLCGKDRPLKLGWPPVPEAAISFAIEPKAKGDDEKIGEALARLTEEDPTLEAGRDPQTGEFLISGSGQLHVEIAVAKLKKRFHVEVVLHPPKVPYRETVRRPAKGHGRHKKQTGGRGQFADCRITIEPLTDGTDFEFVDEIFGGSIPQGYRPAVEKGIQEARARGYLAGYPVANFRVRLQDGQYHDVDSSEMAFKVAGSLAFKDAMASAAPTMLEPIMKVDISVGEEFMGDIMSDLSQRRGRPQGMETTGNAQLVKATVPMAEMLNYAPALRSMTQGRGSFHMEFSHYEEVPRPVQEKLIEEAKRAKEED